MSLYLDSAYVAKCYINEPDAPRVRDPAALDTNLQSSALCLAEMACIFHRHIRERALTRNQVRQLRSAFLDDIENGAWLLHPVSDALIRRVEVAVRSLPSTLFVRAGDAIHLVTARDAGFSEIWTNDRHLLGAARHFGLRGRTV